MKKVILCILDGIGIRDEEHGNAFKLALTPNLDALFQKYPHCKLQASGVEVGLPAGQMGNSEVGHMNIGAGRIVYQPLEFINKAIDDKSFFENSEFLKVIKHTKEKKSKLHIMGLVSDGGVHSHIDHLFALLDLCKQQQVENLYLHLFTDGRDVSPTSACSYIKQVEEKLKELGIGSIATISGRYYAMDRDNNYDRIKRAYDAIVYGIGKTVENIEKYIQDSYEQNITDEFLNPVVLNHTGKLEDGDGIIVFNYRKDRLRELFTAITNPDFHEMPVEKFSNVYTVTMMPVVSSVKATCAFLDSVLTNTLGEYLEKQGLTQLRIAETEKYAHVTFFFDGGKEIDYDREMKYLVASPKVATYDLKPEMSALEITEYLIKEIQNYDVVILNYANGDMLGHTGDLDAAMKAVETIDLCVGRLYQKVQEIDGILMITADHGNCEEMLDSNNQIVTSHTTNLVPFLVTNENIELKNGNLASIAPTMLTILGLPIPDEMTGESLIK